MIFSKHGLGALGLALLAQTAMADGLVIAPTRLVFAPGQRTMEASLTNSSDKPVRYRLELVDQTMTVSGTVVPVSDTATLPYSAKAMVRYMPKLVSIDPGKRQVVRLMANRPESLADGDYHAHLLVEEIAEPKATATPKADSNGLALEVRVAYSMGVPVIVQQGALDSAVQLQSATLVRDAAGKVRALNIKLGRTGNAEGVGYLTASYADGKPATTPRIVRLYREIDHADLQMPLLKDARADQPAELTVQLKKGPAAADALLGTVTAR